MLTLVVRLPVPRAPHRPPLAARHGRFQFGPEPTFDDCTARQREKFVGATRCEGEISRLPCSPIDRPPRQLGQTVIPMPGRPVGVYGSGFATPAKRSAIQWIMSGADGPMTPA